MESNTPADEEPSAARAGARRAAVITGILCLLGLALLTWSVTAGNGLARVDPHVQELVVRHRVTWLTDAFRVLTWLGSTVVLTPLVVTAGAIVLFRKREIVSAFLPPAALLVTVLAKNAGKVLIERPRPSAALAIGSNPGFAFPSGHAADSLAAYAMIALILSAGRSPRARLAIWAGVAAVVLVVGASRVYLGAHWLTDILGGWALAGAIVALLAGAFSLPGEGTPSSAEVRPPAEPAET